MKNKILEILNKLKNKGAFSILLGTLSSKFVAFFASIFVVRLLTKEQYGQLSYFENIYSYFYIFAGLGLANSILRYVVIKESKIEKLKVFNYSINVGSLFNFLLIVLASIFVFFVPRPREFSGNSLIFEVVILLLPIRYIIDCCLNLERATFDNNNYALHSFLLSFIVVFFRILGAKFDSLRGAVYFPFFAQLLFMLFLYIFSIKKNFSMEKTEFSKLKEINLEKKEINSYSFQYMITNGLWAIFMLNDVFILGNFLKNANLVAEYKVAYVLPACLSIFSSAIGIFVGPYFTKNEKNGNYNWVWNNWKKVCLVSIVSIGVISIILFIFANIFIKILYGDTYLSATKVMQILTISSFINSALRFPTANILASVGKIKINLVSAVIGVITQIILDLLVVNKFGILGIAFVNILVYSLMSALIIISFIKNYKKK